MVSLWIAIILFAIWIAYIAVVQTVTAGFWILLAFAVAFLIVHLFVRTNMRRT
jgi:hypothetical protein